MKKPLEQKFEAFFMHHFPKVKHFAWKLVKSEQDAEDIAQDIFLKLWNTPDLWNNDTRNLDAYLYQMTRNKVIDLTRQRYKESGYSIDELYDAGLSKTIQIDSPLDDLYYKEIRLILKLSLERMPKQRRKIFELSRGAGMSNQQIADMLNISVRTVEHHLYLALSELKKKLIVAFLLLFL